MTSYTREELNGVRKYKRELRVRRRRLVKKLIKTIAGSLVVALIFCLLGQLFNILGIEDTESISPLDKYPTPQSYIDYLNSLPGTTEHLTVEDVYGNSYSWEVR